MKTFRGEFAHSYKTYSFGYCLYAEKEPEDTLSDIYSQGFLPYTGTPEIKNTLYMARSTRVDLKKFSPNSENRRVLKKFDDTLRRESKSLSGFNYKDEDFLAFCLKYFEKRHGPHVMPKERLLTVLEAGFITDIITYHDNGNIVGYAFEVNDDEMGHYWFSFYDLDYAYQSLGLWIMLDCIREAQKQEKSHYYVGTVYGEKALYKTNLDSLEYWDGSNWIIDTKKLKARAREDEKRTFDAPDEWKEDHELF